MKKLLTMLNVVALMSLLGLFLYGCSFDMHHTFQDLTVDVKDTPKNGSSDKGSARKTSGRGSNKGSSDKGSSDKGSSD
jgi:hypothetical protein